MPYSPQDAAAADASESIIVNQGVRMRFPTAHLITTSAVVLCLAIAARAQDIDVEHRAFQIGAINYSGYGGLPIERIQQVLPVHTGDALTIATFSKKAISDALLQSTGKEPTDITVACCDSAGRLLMFVGLAGSTSRKMPTKPVPVGDDRLGPQAVGLYDAEIKALEQAVARGAAGEDDSQGLTRRR
jgi:hypothetical protein